MSAWVRGAAAGLLAVWGVGCHAPPAQHVPAPPGEFRIDDTKCRNRHEANLEAGNSGYQGGDRTLRALGAGFVGGGAISLGVGVPLLDGKAGTAAGVAGAVLLAAGASFIVAGHPSLVAPPDPLPQSCFDPVRPSPTHAGEHAPTSWLPPARNWDAPLAEKPTDAGPIRDIPPDASTATAADQRRRVTATLAWDGWTKWNHNDTNAKSSSLRHALVVSATRVKQGQTVNVTRLAMGLESFTGWQVLCFAAQNDVRPNGNNISTSLAGPLTPDLICKSAVNEKADPDSGKLPKEGGFAFVVLHTEGRPEELPVDLVIRVEKKPKP